MEQLLAHIFGDYILQSDWMAMNKSKRTIPCLVHVLLYTSVFILLGASWQALLVIGSVHFVFDRWHYPLKMAIWLKNHLNPKFRYPPFSYCDMTGYYDDSPYTTEAKKRFKETEGRIFKTLAGEKLPEWWGDKRLFFITMWLYIITDNFLHLLTNYLALKYL